jgi:hypothetical protein
MNHELVETQHSIEKYTLDELSPDERAQFEEHLFDCPICADLVRQNFTVVENLKEVLRQKPLATAITGWRAWLQPHSLVPILASLALACVLFYQDFGPMPGQTAEILPQVPALKATTRGTATVVVVNRKSAFFVLPVNIDTLPSASFECEFYNAADKKLLTQKSGPMNSDMDLRILLPAKTFPAGSYRLVLRTDAKPDSINSYRFEIQDAK